MSFVLQQVHFSYPRREVLKGIDLELPEGGFIALLGPNGAGKSTLLKVCAGLLQPYRGEVLFNGKELQRYSRLELARCIAYVPQAINWLFPYTCKEVVAMGRYPYLHGVGVWKGEESAEHRKVVLQCMQVTGIVALASRRVTQLSGGEVQRVQIARALAQEAGVLLLDEPTSHLDIKFQLEIMELLADLNRKKGLSILVSLHDLNLAYHYCKQVVLLKDGRIYAQGAPSEVLCEESVFDVFGVSRYLLSRDEQGTELKLMFSKTSVV